MNPLIRQRLHVVFFVFGGIFLFAGLAFMGLPVYTMATFEKVEAIHSGTQHTEDYGNKRVIYKISRQSYRFTPKGGTEKQIGIHSRESPMSITVYFRHTPESEAEFNVSDRYWRNGNEVTVLLTIGIVLLLLGGVGIVAGFVIRAVNRPPVAIPLSPLRG